MILVTGGTGFIGQALVRHLVEDGQKVRLLLRPSRQTPNIPTGLQVQVAIGDVADEDSLRSAVVGVDTIYHLVGSEWVGVSADLNRAEIEGSRNLLRMAEEAGVKRIFYLSHLGADRASAYPVLKVKGIVEEFIRKNGIDYTIIRSSLVFGPNDNFTSDLAKLIALAPLFVPIPGQGETLIQPIWVEDLVTCLVWALDQAETVNQLYEVGGPEFLTIKEVFNEVVAALGLRRQYVYLQPAYMRVLAVIVEYMIPFLPHSIYWLDYLAANRTCEIDSVSRWFGLLPARFAQHLGHLKGENYRRLAFKEMSSRLRRRRG